MEIVKTENAYNGFFKINKVTVKDGDKSVVREVFDRGDSVAALIYNAEIEKFILTKQYRVGAEKELLEIVAGSMDVEGENPTDTLKRELIEEIGYQIDSDDDIVKIGTFYASPGGSSEKIHIFFARVKNKVGDGGGVEDEKIQVVEIGAEELFQMENDKIEDMKTMIAISWALVEFSMTM